MTEPPPRFPDELRVALASLGTEAVRTIDRGCSRKIVFDTIVWVLAAIAIKQGIDPSGERAFIRAVNVTLRNAFDHRATLELILEEEE